MLLVTMPVVQEKMQNILAKTMKDAIKYGWKNLHILFKPFIGDILNELKEKKFSN